MRTDPRIPLEMLENCVCTRVRTAARLVTRAYDAALRPSGLKASQLAVLAAVASDEDDLASIAELSGVLSMDRTTLSRNLKPLVAQNLLSFDEEGGGRAKAVRITRAGEARLKDALPLWRKAQRALGRQSGEQRLAELHGRLLDLIRSYRAP
jgi:DNA-binding MarR family transcriptional regulator